MTTNSGGLLKRGMEASPSPRLEIRVASPMVYSPPAYSGKNVPSFPNLFKVITSMIKKNVKIFVRSDRKGVGQVL